jgi:hypothetical protein
MLRLSKMFGIDPTVGSVCNRVWDTIDGIQLQVSEIPAAAWHQSPTKVWDTMIVSHQVSWIGILLSHFYMGAVSFILSSYSYGGCLSLSLPLSLTLFLFIR